MACDIHGLCGRDTEMIIIPMMATSTATVTPSPTATITKTPRAAFTATRNLVTSTPVIVVHSTEVTPESIQPTRSMPFWQLLGLLGLFLAIASASVIDPRPAAFDRLRESINQFSSQNVHDSSKDDE